MDITQFSTLELNGVSGVCYGKFADGHWSRWIPCGPGESRVRLALPVVIVADTLCNLLSGASLARDGWTVNIFPDSGTISRPGVRDIHLRFVPSTGILYLDLVAHRRQHTDGRLHIPRMRVMDQGQVVRDGRSVVSMAVSAAPRHLIAAADAYALHGITAYHGPAVSGSLQPRAKRCFKYGRESLQRLRTALWR